jgi:hypothetical protein
MHICSAARAIVQCAEQLLAWHIRQHTRCSSRGICVCVCATVSFLHGGSDGIAYLDGVHLYVRRACKNSIQCMRSRTVVNMCARHTEKWRAARGGHARPRPGAPSPLLSGRTLHHAVPRLSDSAHGLCSAGAHWCLYSCKSSRPVYTAGRRERRRPPTRWENGACGAVLYWHSAPPQRLCSRKLLLVTGQIKRDTGV